jgi:hypothetical protein
MNGYPTLKFLRIRRIPDRIPGSSSTTSTLRVAMVFSFSLNLTPWPPLLKERGNRGQGVRG